jgi:hypothetical protein
LCHCGKIPDINNLREKGISLKRFFHYVGEGVMAAKKASERQEGARQDMPFKDMSPMTYFLQLGLTFHSFHHLEIVYSTFKSINGLNHSLGQRPHDLIMSGNVLTDTPEICFTNLSCISIQSS